MKRFIFRARVLAGACAVLAAIGAPAGAQEPIDVLWFGNSFTNALCCGGTRSVPNIFNDIAVAAGHPQPRSRDASANGQGLQYHLTSNQIQITAALPAGSQWEFVVLQDFSTLPTQIGNLALHLSSSLALYQAVANHSPNVVPIMYETWARAPGHSFYAGLNPSFPGGPAQMQQQLRDGYLASTANINAAVGSDLARYAPVGDAWENAGFPLNLYASDRYHAQNRGSLLNALVIYGVIFQDHNLTAIDLSTVVSRLGLTVADGAAVAAIAQATLVPEPGAGALALIVLGAVAARRRRTAAAESARFC